MQGLEFEEPVNVGVSHSHTPSTSKVKYDLNVSSFTELLASLRWEMFEAFLGHFGWFTFNLLFFLQAIGDTDNNYIVGGAMACTVAPLLSYVIILQVKIEHVAKKELWAWLLREQEVWVNFKNRSMKKSVFAFYLLSTLGMMGFAYYFVGEEVKWAAIFGSAVNGAAACLAFWFVWDVESSLDNINKVFLDGPGAQGGMDLAALSYLRDCKVVDEAQLKMFCFQTAGRAAAAKRDKKSFSVDLTNLPAVLAAFNAQELQAFKQSHKQGWWKSSFYATSMIRPISAQHGASLKKTNLLFIASIIVCELGGFWAVTYGYVQ